MPRRLLTAFFFVFCLAAYAPPAGSADGATGITLGGSADSPVKLEVFSDFECPGCRGLFLNAIQPILKSYKDRVCVIYYEFPLENMHQYARPASRYVSAAARLGDQNKLLSLFEALFADQDKWAIDGSLEASVSRALSPEDFQKVKNLIATDLAGIDRDVDRDIEVGMDRKINATPTVFLTHAGKQERVVFPANVNMHTLLSWRLNGLLGK